MSDHISICVCTYRRNQMLEFLLRKLSLLETDGLFKLSVVIVDNDAAGSAGDTVRTLGKELGLDLTYGVESDPTIPAARNHALKLARGNFIAIIDDDEFPPHHWLLTMYRAIQTFDVDGALGPVHPFFNQKPPQWLVKSKFCERPVHRTGTQLDWSQTRTGNVLLKKEVFDKEHLLFDEEMKTGGTDREFFKQAMRRGRRFVAVEEAPVFEIVPEERWDKSYYLRRALVNGFNAQTNAKGEVLGFARFLVLLKSVTAVLGYLMVLPLAACLGTHVMMNCLVRGAHHASRLSAMVGIELVKKRDF